MKQGWTISTIGSVAKVFNGNSINAEEKKAKYEGLEEGYPFIATKDVGVNGEVDYDNGVKIPFDTDFKIAMPDAVFVCAEGGSAGKKVAHIDRKVCFGNKLFALQPIKEKVKGGFLYYAVQEAGFKAQFRLLMAGIIGGVSAKKFNLITIPIPPLSEQQRIVALLDAEFAKIDALKANAEKNLQNAKDLFQAALKKELEPKEGWREYNLQDVCSEFGDYGMSLPSKAFDGIRYLRITDITDWGDLNDDKVSVDTDSIDGKYMLKEGDVLFARTGATVGKTLVYSSDMGVCSYAGYLIRYRPNQEKVIPRMLYYITHSASYYDWVAKMQKTSTLPNISAKLYNSYKLNIPKDIEIQQSIVARLDVLNKKCKTLQANYEKTLSLCDDLKQALLRKAFNGEI